MSNDIFDSFLQLHDCLYGKIMQGTMYEDDSKDKSIVKDYAEVVNDIYEECIHHQSLKAKLPVEKINLAHQQLLAYIEQLNATHFRKFLHIYKKIVSIDVGADEHKEFSDAYTEFTISDS